MSARRPRWALAMGLYLLGIFMGAIDTGIVTPARTIIADDLGVNQQLGIWMITVYTLAYAAAIPVMGKLADRIGRGKVFVGGYVLLLLCYVIAGFELGGFAGVIVVLLLLGTFYAATDGVMSALATRLVPAASRASGISAAQTVVAMFRFVASLGFGLLWQFGSLQIAMLVMGIGLALAIPLAGALLHIRTETLPSAYAGRLL